MRDLVLGSRGIATTSFQAHDHNTIHVVFENHNFYHPFSIAQKLMQDARLESYKFSISLYSTCEVLTKKFIETYGANKHKLQDIDTSGVVKFSFLNKLKAGDIVLACGGEELLYATSIVANQNTDIYVYFGASKLINNFVKEKNQFNLISLFPENLKEDEFDDDDIIQIRKEAAFSTQNILLDGINFTRLDYNKFYTFVIMPFLNDSRKEQIRNTKFTNGFKVKMEAMLEGIKLAYLHKPNNIIVILSNLEIELDIETELSLKSLVKSYLNNQSVKVRFLHQDYIKENNIPNILSHLSKNENNKIVIPYSNFSELLFLLKGNV